jgi:diaminopimelate dehydrogenase
MLFYSPEKLFHLYKYITNDHATVMLLYTGIYKPMQKINVAIVGNGKLGNAIKQQILKRPKEFHLAGMFSHRIEPDTIPLDKIHKYKSQTDVVLFCGSSKGHCPATELVPWLNQIGFNTVDSYDDHNEIKNSNYLNLIRTASGEGNTTAIIGAGWDPGYLSLQRIYNRAILPEGAHNTLYGGTSGGLSMGHTTALKNIDGVITAVQFTHARQDAQKQALRGKYVDPNHRHLRVCYVVAEPGRENEIQQQIHNIDGYFKHQQVEIHFITLKEFNNKHADRTSHVGQIISADANATINLQLKMKSNPTFTANAMLAFAKANFKMQQMGIVGAHTVADVPPSLLVDEQTHLNEI